MAAVAAFHRVKEALAKNPQPGTPEWHEFHRLFTEAIEANAAYIRRCGSQFTSSWYELN